MTDEWMAIMMDDWMDDWMASSSAGGFYNSAFGCFLKFWGLFLLLLLLSLQN